MQYFIAVIDQMYTWHYCTGGAGGGGGGRNGAIDIKEEWRKTEKKKPLNVTRIMIINENGHHEDISDYDFKKHHCWHFAC